MATKTTQVPTVDQAADDLDRATATLANVRRKVVEGATTVGPADITKAKADLEYAELRLQLAQEAARHRAEQDALARATELTDTLQTGSLAERARRVLDLEAAARQALAALWEATRTFADDATAIAVELVRIDPTPDHIDATGGSQGVRLAIDGTPHPAIGNGNWAGDIVRGAIHTALPQTAHDLADIHRTTSRALIGGPSERRTRADQLRDLYATPDGQDT